MVTENSFSVSFEISKGVDEEPLVVEVIVVVVVIVVVMVVFFLLCTIVEGS